MMALFGSVLICAGLGALLGRFGQCNSGACPLTANWRRGAVYGAVLGALFHFAVGSGTYQQPKNIKAIKEAEFDAEVARAGRPVVVDFYAPWCGPCKVLAPQLDKLAGEFGDRIKFVSVNVDDSPALAAKFGVEGVPTLAFLKQDGAVSEMIVGVASVEVMRAKLLALVQPERAESAPGAGVGGNNLSVTRPPVEVK